MNAHPIHLTLRDDDLSRSRLTVFFRPLLAIPHLIWLALWSVAVFAIYPVVWIIALIKGRLPESIQRFYGAYLRYVVHLSAYLHVVGSPFPGFVGERGSYPVEISVPQEVADQNRWVIFFRWWIALPALFLASALNTAGNAIFLLSWFAVLATGRVPRGLRDLGAYVIRYHGQTTAYVLLLTDRYSHASPYVGGGPTT